MELHTVVIVNDFNYVQGGASKVAINTAKLLRENGKEVYFFSAVNRQENNIEGVKYFTTNQNEALKEKNKLKGAINGIYNIKAKKEFKKLLNSLDNKTTIIHIHGWTKALSSSIFDIAFKMKFKVVLTLHDYFTACPNGGYFNYPKNEICTYKPMTKKCISCNCDSRNFFIKIYRLIRQKIQNDTIKKYKGNVIFVSKFSKEILLKNNLVKNWNSKLIYNPINIPKQDFENAIKNYDYIFVGRLSKEKGVEVFCKAITNLNKKGVIIGDGPLRKELEEKYNDITFVGWKQIEEVKEYLKQSKVLIFSSLWYETMGMTALEALSVGIPVLVGDNCSAMEYIEDGKNGFLYKMGDLEDLMIKMNMCNNEKIEQMSKKAYSMYWDNPLSEEKYIKEIENYYKEIMNMEKECC